MFFQHGLPEFCFFFRAVVLSMRLSYFSILRDFVSSWGKSGFRLLCLSFEVYFCSVKLMKFQQKCTSAYVKNYTSSNLSGCRLRPLPACYFLIFTKAHPSKLLKLSLSVFKLEAFPPLAKTQIIFKYEKKLAQAKILR